MRQADIYATYAPAGYARHSHMYVLRLAAVALGTFVLCAVALLSVPAALASITPAWSALDDDPGDAPGKTPGDTKGTTTGPSALACSPDWQAVNTPNAAVSDNYLNDVGGIASDDYGLSAGMGTGLTRR